jgi:hypothetical protein
MSRPARNPAIPVALALALAGTALAAGCASSPAPPAPAAQAALSAPSLDTSLVTPAGTWAVAVMGGPAAQYNNFWQLFIRPAGSTRWQLVTPPGTADNGGLVLAGSDGQPLVTGFRPSQNLTFSPLIETRDGGRAWSSLSPLDAALASTPDALAIKPGSGSLLALLAGGTAELAVPGYTTWTILARQQTLAATSPGQRCGLQSLTAATFTPSGIPVLAGTCTRPGTAGIFTSRGGTWQAAGPAIPAALARQDITVLRLTRTTQGIAALLAAGTGPAASLLAAWSADDGGHWTLSPALKLSGPALTSASFGPGSTAAIMTGNRGDIITSAGSPWRPLPPLPPGTATLAPGPGGAADALAVHRGTLTVWRLAPGGAAWARTQAINVPILYGSSS